MRAYLGTGALAGVLTLLIVAQGRDDFARVLGPVPPLFAVALAALAGWLALRALLARGWLPARGARRELLTAALAGAGFAVPMAALDYAVPFSADINVALPWALAFYPAAGFLAEAFFHLAPLALLLALWPRGGPQWPVLLAVAAVEPAFQMIFGGSLGRDLAMAGWLTLFGLFQLAMLRRGGFAALFLARIGYYVVWHGIWGTLRLEVLFGTA